MSSLVALPSIHALRSTAEELLAHDLTSVEVRIQAAIVRALLDEVGRLAPSRVSKSPVTAQLVEEIARLGAPHALTS